jgi:N-formylmaleamate deformylase
MYPNWLDNTLLVDGKQFHYVRTGNGSKPALVLAHGFSDNGLCWLPTAQALEADYDVIMPDARGHGLSARVQPGEVVDMAADLAGFIQGLGLNQPVLGGHSMGGLVSSQVGARYPGLVRALILEDPAWFEPKMEEKLKEAESPNPFAEWLAKLDKATLEQVMAKCRADSPTWREIELLPWANSKKQFDQNFLKLGHAEEVKWPEVARLISCPTLLITSDIDKGAIISAELARKAVEMNVNIHVANVSGVGHNIRRENFDGFLRVVKDFLQTVK